MVFTQQKLKERSSVVFLLYLNETFLLWWNYANLQLTFIFCFSCEVVITWSRSVKMKFCPVLTGSQQFYKLVINCLAITCRNFHPGQTGSLFCTAGIRLCWDDIFPSSRFSLLSRLKFFKNFFTRVGKLRRWKPTMGRKLLGPPH